MLTKYIQAAMKRAQYEILEDKSYCGSIAGFDGVWVNEPTLVACREELQGSKTGFCLGCRSTTNYRSRISPTDGYAPQELEAGTHDLG